MTEEGTSLTQADVVAEELEPTCGMQLLQVVEEQPPEQLCEHANRQQEPSARRDPALSVERDTAAGHDHVDVRVVRHGRAPGVEDGGDTDARTEMTRVGGDGEHGLGGHPEQQIIDHRLVVEGDVGDLGGHCEDDVEIADRQQVGLACGEPLACCRPLALGAVPIPAAVVGDAAVAAVLAAFDMAAERGRAAGLDRRHHLELGQAHVAGMRRAPGWSMNAKDIGDLERRSQRDQPPPGSSPSISSLRCSSGLVTARIVLVATRA